MSPPGVSPDHTVGQRHSAVLSGPQHASAWKQLPAVAALHGPVSLSGRLPLPVCLVQSLESPAAVNQQMSWRQMQTEYRPVFH